MRESRTLYVRLKCGDAAIPAPERLRACAAAVADRVLPTPTRATFAHLGAERSLADVCRWHIDRLQDDA